MTSILGFFLNKYRAFFILRTKYKKHKNGDKYSPKISQRQIISRLHFSLENTTEYRISILD